MRTFLFATAAGLGLLAFFEPCTIATHTLFAVRASRDGRAGRWHTLTQLVLSRGALLAVLFGIAAWIGWDRVSMSATTIPLGALGAVYLVTRKAYLPVPHFEFFRLLPGYRRLSQASRLGLTLPACTLPLVAVVGALAAAGHEIGAAMIAGLIFAAMFSLPTLWDSLWGLSAVHRAFLGKAAKASPYLTALLLWGGGLLIWQGGI